MRPLLPELPLPLLPLLLLALASFLPLPVLPAFAERFLLLLLLLWLLVSPPERTSVPGATLASLPMSWGTALPLNKAAFWRRPGSCAPDWDSEAGLSSATACGACGGRALSEALPPLPLRVPWRSLEVRGGTASVPASVSNRKSMRRPSRSTRLTCTCTGVPRA